MTDTPPRNAPDAHPPASPATAPVADGSAPAQDPPKVIKPRRGTVIAMLLVALVGIMAILYAWRFWPFTSAITTTENAYVRGQITVMAPQVNGYVAQVLVRDFETVRQGQTLISIDDRIYRQRVEQSLADLDARRADLANSVQTQASDQATLESRRAELYSAQAEADRAKADELRVNELASRGSVSVRERDQIRATARAAGADVKKAQAAIRIAEETVKSTRVSRDVLAAQVRTAEAALHLAQIDLDNTLIKAPIDGRLSEVSVRLGQYVVAGSQLLYLVPEQLWVIANYKETQTHDMAVGQTVTIDVDALESQRLTGHIERLAPATGSEFSVLRADNATGNFTKVAQRIPVRIALDANQPLLGKLKPGMSVVTHVDTASATNGTQP
ncbi:HlyD family secretion protein [Pseudomonas typographi]|uniref:HlyD family secretion protein n=1 Tax=Pseudomonas typographi TaxID=2715964 RepID=A0ABR7YWK9_9PSED|nr:HlyD family secretion protein [Pseudomonas typographi]MBD1552441.1 HlyD family secretion protein [Pseudomonas typographi]MBD1585531.1 HlyD family secretion protein [Pseudomonas typographi]MBD1597554.1 HlyD family secretion protein [Pseudomonas typographi]